MESDHQISSLLAGRPGASHSTFSCVSLSVSEEPQIVTLLPHRVVRFTVPHHPDECMLAIIMITVVTRITDGERLR